VERLRRLDKPTEATYRVKPSVLRRLGGWAGAAAIGGAVVGGLGLAAGGAVGAIGAGFLAAFFDPTDGDLENVKGTIQSRETSDGDSLVFQPKDSDKVVDLQLFSQAKKEFAFYDENQWWQ
jgi:hypothetical protein